MQLCSTSLDREPIRAANLFLTRSQKKAAEDLQAALALGQVCLLRARTGMGKTTVLQALQRETAATLVGAGHFLTLLKHRSPSALEETFMEVLEQGLRESDTLLVDDLHLVTSVLQSYDYPRANLINVVMNVILALADSGRKKLVFATDGETEPVPVRNRALTFQIEDFEPEDFAAICRAHLNDNADQLDFEKVHCFAPSLNGHQLKNACLSLKNRESSLTTTAFIDYLQSRDLASNVDLEDVEAVAWSDLKGLESLVEELEAKVALPFENQELALKLNLKPKRGVLLAGPPGTGKTTIGRALAHRLKGKFFLIDGTVNAAANQFYERVEEVFEAAKRNAPSVIFIDDADVIFEAGNQGLYRYLLTKLDGLEGAGSTQVCVMLTAMDTAALPPALLRSGRVELWLTTRLPDEKARQSILREKFAALPPPVCRADIDLLARASKGLSGADLKAVVEEGKLLYGRALTTGRTVLPIEQFFLQAIRTSLANRRNYGKRSHPLGDSNFGFKPAL